MHRVGLIKNMVKPPLRCCYLLVAALTGCRGFGISSIIRQKTHDPLLRHPTSKATTILFSTEAAEIQEQEENVKRAREETRNLRSLFSRSDEDNHSSISEFKPEQLRQLRREIIARRRRRQNEIEDDLRDQQDFIFIFTAFVPFILAFMTWEDLSRGLAQWLNDNAAIGQAVDGNKFASDLLRPTITGVVVPVISIALATLVSTTVNVLRARQVDIRALINKESCDLRLLRRAIFGMFGTRQHAGRRSRALTLLKRYVDQINRESTAGAIERLQVLELSGGVATNELDELSAMLHGVDGAAASRQGSVDSADAIISRLNSYRSDRVALLLTDFPDLHWIVLAALSVSICVTFLLESNQLVNQYLNSIQLRSLFALLVGVFSATATLCIDLADPFTGSFSIAGTSAQVGDLRLCLLEDAREARSEASELSFSTFRFFPSPSSEESNGGKTSNGKPGPMKGSSKRNPSRYGNNFLSTVYFHLLTSPVGSNVRAIAELFAWGATVFWKRARSILDWRAWPWMKQESKRKLGFPWIYQSGNEGS